MIEQDKFPPWFNEETQGRIARHYCDNGVSVERIMWMMDLCEEDVRELLEVGVGEPVEEVADGDQ